MNYIKRINDKKLQEYANIFGAVVVEGPKWCGKTETCTRLAKSELKLGDAALGSRNRNLLTLDPVAALSGDSPRLIDEWQLVPECWDMVKSTVDKIDNETVYLLTGSSTPRNDTRTHSGAGRMGKIRMDTLTMKELGISNGTFSIGKMLQGDGSAIKTTVGKLSVDDIIEQICRGGWPKLADKDLKSSRILVSNYYKSVIEAAVPDSDTSQSLEEAKVKWHPAKMDAIFQSLARNVATTVNNSTILEDISSYTAESMSTYLVNAYLNIVEQLFLLINIPAWNPALKSNVRLRSTPKRILADPSLATAALKASPKALKEDFKYLGDLFESLVLKDLSVYAGFNDASLYYYNDYNNLEIDAVIEGEDKNWGAIEIKLGHTGEEKGAANLLSLKNKISEEKQKPPKFLAVVTGVGSILHQTEDGVWIVPVDCLGE